MALFDDLFPTTRDARLVQTEWTEDWFDYASGFGYAAEYLTEHRAEFGARIDQTGVAVFFLQRHRVETILKALLDAVGADVPGRHGLEALWARCRAALESRDGNAWKTFAEDHAELVRALERADRSSTAFRYPVDNHGEKMSRPPFVDLAVLNEHVDRLYDGASGYVDYLDSGREGDERGGEGGAWSW